MDETKFYFGRISFKHQLQGLDDFAEGAEEFNKVDRIRERLLKYTKSTEPVYADEDAVWRFGRVEEHGETIIGRFGKVFTDQPMQFDDDEKDFVQSDDNEEIADVSHFIIYPSKNVIAFNRKKHIGHKQFVKVFAAGYGNFYGMPEGITISLLKNSIEVEELLSVAERIHELDFDLVPTNPIRDDEMKVLDEPMREIGADEFSIAAESETGSLNPRNSFVRSGFALSNNGYGDFKITYEVGGETKFYDSRDKPATLEIEEPDGIGGLRVSSETIFNQVKQLTISED
ncbi:hypothetical protein [Haloferax sp. DFSO60]|uniref:hypothetical protein n=1 Tax=Haloferax sp. DFSO60 TaxID=3388652 RepID=UPI0039791647